MVEYRDEALTVMIWVALPTVTGMPALGAVFLTTGFGAGLGVGFGVFLIVGFGVALGVGFGVALTVGVGLAFTMGFGVLLTAAFGVALAVVLGVVAGFGVVRVIGRGAADVVVAASSEVVLGSGVVSAVVAGSVVVVGSVVMTCTGVVAGDEALAGDDFVVTAGEALVGVLTGGAAADRAGLDPVVGFRFGTRIGRELADVAVADVVTGRATSDGRLWSGAPVETALGST